MATVFNLSRYKTRRQNLRNQVTPHEQLLWQSLRKEQLGVKFRRQHGVGHYIVDFYCSISLLIIELDGDSHFTPEAKAYDFQRDAYLQSLGMRVLRFTNADVQNNLDSVLKIIRRTLGEPPPSLPLRKGEEPRIKHTVSMNAVCPSPAKGRLGGVLPQNIPYI